MNKEECIEALHKIQGALYVGGGVGFVCCDEIELFDELIDEHFKLVESLNKHSVVSTLIRDIKRLEKALDKACEGLAENCYLDDTTQKIKDAYYFSKADCVPLSAEEWKEWCGR